MASRKKASPKQSLTPKEKGVLDFLHLYFAEHAMAPSYREIKEHFGFASFFSVQRYLKQLDTKGYILAGGDNQKRGLQLLAQAEDLYSKRLADQHPQRQSQLTSNEDLIRLPLLGRVAAGLPIERIEHGEFFELSRNLVPKPESSFILRVEGQSMIEDGILDGDYLIVQSQKIAKNGDTIIARVDNEATVKNLFYHPDKGSRTKNKRAQIELRPANQQMQSLFYSPEEVEIQGIVVGLVRKYG